MIKHISTEAFTYYGDLVILENYISKTLSIKKIFKKHKVHNWTVISDVLILKKRANGNITSNKQIHTKT